MPSSIKALNNVSILLSSVDNNLNVTFTEAPNSPITVGTTPVAIATGDLNADGVPDLAVVNQGDNTVSVLLGSANLDGTFTAATGSPLPTAATPAGIVIANFANSAVPDIAVTNKGSNTLGVYLGLGNGTFASRIELNTPAQPSAVIAAVLTSTGLPDAALVSQDPTTPNQGEVTVIQDSTSFANGAANGVAQTPYPASEYVDLGVKIKATPTLHPNNEVTLHARIRNPRVRRLQRERDSRHLQSHADANRARQTGRNDPDRRSYGRGANSLHHRPAGVREYSRPGDTCSGAGTIRSRIRNS